MSHHKVALDETATLSAELEGAPGVFVSQYSTPSPNTWTRVHLVGPFRPEVDKVQVRVRPEDDEVSVQIDAEGHQTNIYLTTKAARYLLAELAATVKDGLL